MMVTVRRNGNTVTKGKAVRVQGMGFRQAPPLLGKSVFGPRLRVSHFGRTRVRKNGVLLRDSLARSYPRETENLVPARPSLPFLSGTRYRQPFATSLHNIASVSTV